MSSIKMWLILLIYWFQLLSRLTRRQLSKQVVENWLWYIWSQIITCMSTPVRRIRDVLGYAHLSLAHESQRKGYCTQATKQKELSRERLGLWWWRWYVATNFTLCLRRKHVAYPSFLKSSLRFNIYAHNPCCLVLCNEAGEHLRGLFLLRSENSASCRSSLTQACRGVQAVPVASPVHHAGTVTAGSYLEFLGVSYYLWCWLE